MNFKEHFINCYPNEGVGYVKAGEFFPLQNIAEDPHHKFEIDPVFLLEEPELLLHSHCVGGDITYQGNPHEPSYDDLTGQIATAIEWGICVTDGEVCEDPITWGNPENRPPLLDRDFIFNIQDCYTLVQDWFYEESKIELPNLARTPFWNEEGQNLLEDNFEAFGFERVELSDLKRGDVLFYKVRSPVVNHLGVYLGNDEVISHWFGRISCVEEFSKWAAYIEFAARKAP